MSSLQALQFVYNTVQIINYTPYHNRHRESPGDRQAAAVSIDTESSWIQSHVLNSAYLNGFKHKRKKAQ